MRPRAGSIGLALAAIVAFAACTAGGGGGASVGTPSSVGSAAPSVATSVAPPAPASAAASAATGSSSGPCALVTAEEVAQIVGVDVTAVEADERSCIYETPPNGAIVALVQRTTEGAAELYADFKGNPESTPVNDLGDEAVWLPGPESVQLHVLQGDDMLSIGVGTLSGVPVDELTGTSPEVLVDMATQVGKIAVGRL